jgi:hypothetical protein
MWFRSCSLQGAEQDDVYSVIELILLTTNSRDIDHLNSLPFIQFINRNIFFMVGPWKQEENPSILRI